MAKNLKIIIADDHSVVRRGIKEFLLAAYPFAHIEEVNNGNALLEKVMADKWDVVICDIKMSDKSGIEALQQIKRLLPALPVLMMSVYPESYYAVMAFEAGASGFLSKDTIHEHLVEAVEKVLIGKKYITPAAATELVNALTNSTDKPIHKKLSKREFQVYTLLTAGKSTSTIAKDLSLSVSTISTLRQRILKKNHMGSNAELIIYSKSKI